MASVLTSFLPHATKLELWSAMDNNLPIVVDQT